MPRILTCSEQEFDTIASIWAWQQFYTMRCSEVCFFTPNDWDALEEKEDGIVIGLKAENSVPGMAQKGEGEVIRSVFSLSCFCFLNGGARTEALAPLMLYLDLQKMTEEVGGSLYMVPRLLQGVGYNSPLFHRLLEDVTMRYPRSKHTLIAQPQCALSSLVEVEALESTMHRIQASYPGDNKTLLAQMTDVLDGFFERNLKKVPSEQRMLSFA